jgi:secreted protein with Ig-like and vWFA domain
MTAIMALGAFLPGLFGKTLPAKYTKLLGTALLILGAILLLGLGKWAYDASVIAQHEARQRAEVARKQLEADREADAKAAEDARKLAQTQKELEQAARDAAAADPAGAAKPVGPVSQSYYDTLRKQKESK